MKRKLYQFIATLFLLVLILGMVGCSEVDQDVGNTFTIESQVTKESLDHLEINLDLPMVSGFGAADMINREINDSVVAAKVEVEDAAAIMKADGSQLSAGLGSSFQYSQSGDIVSIWIMMDNYTGGAHGLYWLETYTFNTATNEIYALGSIFQDGKNYTSVMNDKFVSVINEAPDNYFPSAVETVLSYNGDLPFYINGNTIVVYFSLYEITPYAAGIQYFEFDAEELKDLLKPEIFNAIKDTEPVKNKGTIFEH